MSCKPYNIKLQVNVLINLFFLENFYLQASSNIISGSPMFAAKLIVQNLDLMLIGDEKTINERSISRLGSSTVDVKEYWRVISFSTFIC